MEKKTYFISGSSKFDVKDFIKLYIPLIDAALKEDAYFVIGDCDGVDAMAQSYLNQKLKDEEKDRVKIFFKGSTPQNFLSVKFMAIGNFTSHEEAAIAMTLCSDEDIACLEEGYWNSLTAKNILRRYTPKFNFNPWMTSKTGNTKFWEALTNFNQD